MHSYFEDCECLLFLFIKSSYTIGVTLFPAKGSLFMQEKIIFWERHLLIKTLAPTLFEESLSLWVFEVPYISIPQDLFHAFYPNLLPAYLWHTLSSPVSGIFRLFFVHSKQGIETNQDLILKQRCMYLYEYMLYTPNEQTELEFSHLGENHFSWSSCGVSEELEIGGVTARCENTIGTIETCLEFVYL